MSLWDNHGLAVHELRAGSFSEDSRGRWYLNVAVQVQSTPSPGTAAVGIDLGLKACAIMSMIVKLESRLYRCHEQAFGIAQRTGKKNRARAVHAKIKNQRKDALHQFSTQLVRENAAIFVGDVASAKLVKTQLAKSTLDAGWAMFKTMLECKSHQVGVVFEEVNEAHSTQTCSSCASVEGPKGLSGLGIRQWTCSCGAVHDCDVNAARNMAARGLAPLAKGTSA